MHSGVSIAHSQDRIMDRGLEVRKTYNRFKDYSNIPRIYVLPKHKAYTFQFPCTYEGLGLRNEDKIAKKL